jgi:hypothetical protein
VPKGTCVIWTIGLCLAGIFLGLNWNVLILMPATAGLLIVSGILGLVGGTSAHDAIATILMPIVALQAGYMLGIGGRDVLGRYIQKRASTHTKHV